MERMLSIVESDGTCIVDEMLMNVGRWWVPWRVSITESGDKNNRGYQIWLRCRSRPRAMMRLKQIRMSLMMVGMGMSMGERGEEECGRKLVWMGGVPAFMVRRLEVDQPEARKFPRRCMALLQSSLATCHHTPYPNGTAP